MITLPKLIRAGLKVLGVRVVRKVAPRRKKKHRPAPVPRPLSEQDAQRQRLIEARKELGRRWKKPKKADSVQKLMNDAEKALKESEKVQSAAQKYINYVRWSTEKMYLDRLEEERREWERLIEKWGGNK